MNKYIIALYTSILVIVSIFNTQAITASSLSNTIYGYRLDDCSSGTILLDAVNKTIENITNVTGKEILYRVVFLLEKLDCNTVEQMVRFINLHLANVKIKQYHSSVNHRRGYTRLNNGAVASSGMDLSNNKSHIFARNTSIDYMGRQNNRIDPLLVVINIVSIISFAIGIYLFRIIKKRMDYI